LAGGEKDPALDLNATAAKITFAEFDEAVVAIVGAARLPPGALRYTPSPRASVT